jgi:hypothetical protein
LTLNHPDLFSKTQNGNIGTTHLNHTNNNATPIIIQIIKLDGLADNSLTALVALKYVLNKPRVKNKAINNKKTGTIYFNIFKM